MNNDPAASCIPWNVYPRPALKRDEWLCLNGDSWNISFDGYSGKINVPFCPESELSGVKMRPKYGEIMIYRRSFSVPEAWNGKRLLLHFGAVSRLAKVFVNGTLLGSHENSYLPFTIDITGACLDPETGRFLDENELELRVINDISHKHPWGKQKEKRGGMWYTPVSGIWQTVWLEPVPEQYIQGLDIDLGIAFDSGASPLSASVSIKLQGVSEGSVLLEGKRFGADNGEVRIEIENPRLWSPEDPQLYEFTAESGEDRVQSYFALRSISARDIKGKKRLCLNDKPYFFNGLLDQGYWSEGIYTPAGPEGFEKDILAMKSLGYNTLRKHIKVEPQLWYYLCDKLGMAVFQDMVNCGDYVFLRDTGLPTINIQKLDDRMLNRDKETRANFLEAMEETVRLLKNHPSIVLWTIFNEGWGQFCADEAYERMKDLDNRRIIDATSGWFHQKKSDVDSLHIYFKKLRMGREKLPQLLSEFGGYVWKLDEHSFNKEKTYGYKILKDRESYIDALKSLYLDQLLPLAREGLCGAIYTQVSDVEDETNGLFTYDREVLKVEPEDLKGITALLQEAVRK